MQHAKRMRHIMLSSVACLAVKYLSINGTNLLQTLLNIKMCVIFTYYKMCVLIFSTVFILNIFHCKMNGA
jgi:hypothetical protein